METLIIGIADAEAMKEFTDRWCNHSVHSATLCDLDENRKFRTRVAQAYPQEMCAQLAKAHVRYVIMKPPKAGSAELSSKMLLDAVDQLRQERGKAVAQNAPPPVSLEASG